MTREEAEEACEGEPGVLFCDGYDNCILGFVHHPVCKIVYDGDAMLQAMIDQTQSNVSGRVRIKIYKGNVMVTGRESPFSLYNNGLATFEDDDNIYSQQDAEGFIKLNALRLRKN